MTQGTDTRVAARQLDRLREASLVSTPASERPSVVEVFEPARGGVPAHVGLLASGLLARGWDVTVVGPPPLIPRGIESMGCDVSYDIETIKDADVVYVLRMQKERMLEGANYVPSLREYTACWGVTSERLRPGQKVMHPGPMNRGVEIDPVVADAADALIERQVRSGLVVRMAVLYDLLTHGPVEVKVAEIEEVA